MQAPRLNRGTFRRGFNQLITCECCGRKTQSQISSGAGLCGDCFDFAGICNEVYDACRTAAELPKPTHNCPNCLKQWEGIQHAST